MGDNGYGQVVAEGFGEGPLGLVLAAGTVVLIALVHRLRRRLEANKPLC